jgi:hypothetical protein
LKYLSFTAPLLVGSLLALGQCAPRVATAQAAVDRGGAAPSLIDAPRGLAAGASGAVFQTARDSIARTPHPAVARIIAPGKGSVSYGSGTLIDANEKFGLVITNWHVINEASGPITVLFPDGFSSIGTIQKVDRDWDLAAIAIYKPNAQPVPMAGTAPQPGESLMIAGYGSGTYRAARGPCTQYVAPGVKFPYEMVELAASARQGDSGGPIFNSRGELAGVLFGEGNGRTSGSYCGRVQWFLTSTGQPSSRTQAAPTAIATRPPQRVESFPDNASNWRSTGEDSRTAQSFNRPSPAAPVARIEPSTGDKLRAPMAPLAASNPATTQYVGWNDMAGDTFGEQVKTVLAALGALGLLLHTLRWLATSSG